MLRPAALLSKPQRQNDKLMIAHGYRRKSVAYCVGPRRSKAHTTPLPSARRERYRLDMHHLRSLLWFGAILLGGWFLLQFLLPDDPHDEWSKIDDYCREAHASQVSSEAEANSLATRHGLTPQRSVDDHNRVNVLVLRPALLGTDVSCRIIFHGSRVDVQYSEPGGLAGVVLRLVR